VQKIVNALDTSMFAKSFGILISSHPHS